MSVIHEEMKMSSDFVPVEEFGRSPYFQNLVIGENKDILYFSNKSYESIENKLENKLYM